MFALVKSDEPTSSRTEAVVEPSFVPLADAAGVSEVADAAGVSEVADAAGVSEVADAAGVSEVADAAGVSEVADAAGVSEVADADSDVSEVADADSDVSGAGDVDDEAADAANGFDYSTEEYSDCDDVYTDILGSYRSKRNIVKDNIADPYFTNQAVIEYLHLKFVDNNCRSTGLTKLFDDYNLTQAHLEFKSFEKWYSVLRKYVALKVRNQDLCLPLFCHLYLNLYSNKEREIFLEFLEIFKHIFVCSKGITFLRELKDVIDMNNLSPCLSLFRKNKIVFKTSPEFLTSLCYFFQRHFLLKEVFQEWFDINYSNNLDPMAILHNYFMNNLSYLPQIQEPIKKIDSIDSLSKENQLFDEHPSTSQGFVSGYSNSSCEESQSNNDEPKNNNIIDDEKNTPNDLNNSNPKGSNLQPEEVLNSKENIPKQSEKNLLNGERKLSIDDINSSECSFGDSVDSASETSTISDEEIMMRKFLKNKLKYSNGDIPFKSTYHMKTTYTTKIEPINIDEDSFLCNTRQISLTNCSKLSCSIITADRKYVAAGSLDSLIYLWERLDTSIESDKNGVLNGNINGEIDESGPKDSNKSNKFVEHLDKSAAFILRGHGGPIFDLAEIRSSKILLSASYDKTFRAWDLVSKLCLEVYDGHEHKMWCVCACPNTLQVITGSSDGNGCLWFLDYKRPLRIFPGHLEDVLIVKMHPSQVFLATGSADKSIRLFELVSGACQRLFVGHKDYISCIEFNVQNPCVLASASGSGEIILWDMFSSDVLWSIKVKDVLLSNITWPRCDVILASLSTGVIMKCNIRENYIDTPKKVKGLTTRYSRLLALKIIDSIVFTIGIPGQYSIHKRSTMNPPQSCINTVDNQSLGEQRVEDSNGPSLLKQFLQQYIKKYSNKLVKPVIESSSKDLKSQLTIDPKDTTLLTPEFFQMDVQNLPFKLTPEEVTRLNSQHVTNDSKLFKKPPARSKSTRKNTASTSAQKNAKMSNFSSSSASQMTDVQQSDSNQSSSVINPQHFKTPNSVDSPVKIILSNIKKNVQLKAKGERNSHNNVSVQQQPMSQSTGVDQQQIQQRPKLKPVSRTRSAKQPTKKSVLQNEQEPQNCSAEDIIQMSNLNALQQPLFQQIRPNTQMTRLSVQQKLSQQQTSIRLGNVNVSQTQLFDFNTQHMSKPILLSSAAGMPIRLAAKSPQQSTSECQLLPGEYKQLCPTSVASLLHPNPELLTRQPVHSEIISSPSVAVPSENPISNSQTESQKQKKKTTKK